MLDPEALLLVDDDEIQVLEPRILGEQAVRADEELDAAVAMTSLSSLSLWKRDSEATLTGNWAQRSANVCFGTD